MDKTQQNYCEAYLAGAKAEFYILLLKVEHMEKESEEYNEFASERYERYAIKVLLDLAAATLDDQQKKDQLHAIATHVLLDTTSHELNEVYQEFTKFTV